MYRRDFERNPARLIAFSDIYVKLRYHVLFGRFNILGGISWVWPPPRMPVVNEDLGWDSRA